MKALNKTKLITLIICSLFFSYGSAQCPKISDLNLRDESGKWTESAQSRTETLKMGESFEVSFIAQRGMDYRIRVLSGAEDLSIENSTVRIYDTDVEKVEEDGEIVYKRTQNKVFDSNSLKTNKEIIITTPKTRKLTVKGTARKSDIPEKTQCMIVYIESRRSEKLGM